MKTEEKEKHIQLLLEKLNEEEVDKLSTFLTINIAANILMHLDSLDEETPFLEKVSANLKGHKGVLVIKCKTDESVDYLNSIDCNAALTSSEAEDLLFMEIIERELEGD